MRKIFSLIAAVLFAGSMMAESITITAESFKSSYGEGTFTLSEVEFAYTGAMYNGKGSPVSAAAKSFIQLRKSANGAGEIKNNDELSLKTITVATQNDKDFTLSAGTASDALEAVTKPAGVAGKYAFTDKEGAAAECDVTVYTFDVEGKKYFDLLNGAAASYIAYITIELGEGGVTPPAVVAPYCQTEVGHFFAANADPNSFVLLSIGSKGGKTIVRIDQDAAKNTQMFDYLQVTGLATDGEDVAEGGATAMAVEFATPDAVDDSITLEILWSTINWPGRWMVQNVKVPATAACEYAVLVPAPVVKKTCAEVYALDDNAEVALNDVTVTYVNGKNVWVKDATGSMLVYLTADATWAAGDVLAGVVGTKTTFKGLVEVKLTADQAAAVAATAGEAPEAEVLTEIDADKDMSKLVLLKGVEADGAFVEGTASNLTITLGENEYTIRNNFKNAFTFDAEKKYDVTAIVTYYNALQLYFISAEEASTTAIDNTVVSEKAIKMFENGQLIIIKNGVKYNALGSVIE
ncbi:MAG: hypothetical protein SPK90_05765 [Bacteroidales bacterium]|nr:hypothetical protein [Bacteroidales bacterium]MDY6406869.1 hypothetical protein [Bacteroidales bacterium]